MINRITHAKIHVKYLAYQPSSPISALGAFGPRADTPFDMDFSMYLSLYIPYFSMIRHIMKSSWIIQLLILVKKKSHGLRKKDFQINWTLYSESDIFRKASTWSTDDISCSCQRKMIPWIFFRACEFLFGQVKFIEVHAHQACLQLKFSWRLFHEGNNADIFLFSLFIHIRLKFEEDN
jgi:hypothetical protein